MKTTPTYRNWIHSLPVVRRLCPLVTAVGLMLATTLSQGDDRHKSKGYEPHFLVSDLPGVAMLQDTNLVNAWGVSFSPTSPFWVSANETGKAVLYSVTNDSAGMTTVAKLSLEVSIPGEGNVTGQVFNNTTNFNGDAFLFVSEDGTVSGWRNALGASAEILATRSGAVYKGVTLASVKGVTFLLAANFSEATVDVYDGLANLVGQLADPRTPTGYAPFNVQSVGGTIFVTFAKQDDDKEDDVAGPGNGFIDVLRLATGRFHRFATGSDAGGRLHAINSPWGVALAPESFGKHGGELLVGNFGSGTIMAFDDHGRFRGLLEDSSGQPLALEGLWALTFGNGGRGGVPGTLYFTAGPGDESHGVFGSVDAVRNHRDQDHDDDDDD